MPLWDIHTNKEIFSFEEKQSLAREITKIYSPKLPAFYVRVRFTVDAPGSSFSGGELNEKPFIHIQIWHIARSFSGPEQKAGFLKRADAVVNPVFEAKGADWEYTIDDSPPIDLWRINGLAPPSPNSAEEQEWYRQNRPIDFRKEKL